MNNEIRTGRSRLALRVVWSLLASMIATPAFAGEVMNDIPGADPMVPFDRYLQPSSYDGPQLSPDGRHIAVLAAVDGVTNLMIADVAKPTGLRPLTRERGRGPGQRAANEQR